MRLFTVENLRIMLGQDIGSRYLVPIALEHLEADPFVAGDFYPGDLLCSVLSLPREFWSAIPSSGLERPPWPLAPWISSRAGTLMTRFLGRQFARP